MTGGGYLRIATAVSLAVAVLALAAVPAGSWAAPSVEVSSHHDRQTVGDEAITLSGTASDPDGIMAVEVSVNRGPWVPAELAGAGQGGNVSWSARLRLAEGANVIAVNVTNATNATSTRTIVINYSIPQGGNGGVILAAGGIIAAVVVLGVLVTRARRPPAAAGDDSPVVDVKPPGEPKD
jgi:hypothetical protein